MTKLSLGTRLGRTFASFRRPGGYGSPRHLNDDMLKDIGLTPQDLGITRTR